MSISKEVIPRTSASSTSDIGKPAIDRDVQSIVKSVDIHRVRREVKHLLILFAS